MVHTIASAQKELQRLSAKIKAEGTTRATVEEIRTTATALVEETGLRTQHALAMTDAIFPKDMKQAGFVADYSVIMAGSRVAKEITAAQEEFRKDPCPNTAFALGFVTARTIEGRGNTLAIKALQRVSKRPLLIPSILLGMSKGIPQGHPSEKLINATYQIARKLSILVKIAQANPTQE